MASRPPLPPHLERFVSEQVAAGRYRSESDVICAALQLLRATAAAPPAGARDESRTAPTERWQSPGDWLTGSPGRESSPAPARRSPRGLLADLRSDISTDDIREARNEMWSGLRHGGA